jgi:aspartate/methionine/tyrosine aminotransferase
MNDFAQRRLTYGAIEGNPAFLEGVCGLYETVEPGHIIPTHGAAGANYLVLSTLCGPGDHVVSIMPTYQQLYSIPEMCGATVDILHLEKDDHYHVDAEKLAALVTDDTKVICINNPDNPTGALLSREEIETIVGIARDHDAWLMCDEVYRLLTQDDDCFTTSPIDLYDKAVVTSSMSKVWSLAGIRLGWAITKSPELRRDLLSHRDYDLISCGMFDEAVGAFALAHADKILARSRRIVRQNLAALEAWVDSEEHLSFAKPEAGTTALVYYDYDLGSYEFCTRMIQTTGALVTPGDAFEEPKSMRIGYAYSNNVDDLKEGLAAISAFLRTLE